MVPPNGNKPDTLSMEFPLVGAQIQTAAAVRAEEQQARSAQARAAFDVIYLVDTLATLVLAVLTFPILVLSCLWVMAVDRGNPFFIQIRIGLNGKPYRIFKVRSMRHDHRNHARFCAHGDERILPGGHFLRKSRIDEIPQLFNVLLGDMALVGPRPEQPAFVKTFTKEIPRYEERVQVKPGVTGLAQISQGYVDSLNGTRIKLKYDLFFIKKRSLGLWLRIVLGTIRIVLFRHGAR
jgi:lipopolysaccharide/colanic/teichoic acid biosynthesis glycosyltransferase